jgi:Putative peptidoglycan binding domain
MFNVRIRRLAALVGFSALALAAAPAWAAADGGAFAIKGIGATDCATAVREYSAGSPNAMMYGGWIYGYLTGLNQLTPGTFDLAPWQDLNTLTNFVVEYCKKNPKTTFSEATFKMAVALNPDRLTARTDYLRFAVNGKGFTLYAATFDRVAAKLVAKGLLKSKPADAKTGFNADMVKALKAFQSSRKLKATGEPDQATLFELLQR